MDNKMTGTFRSSP